MKSLNNYIIEKYKLSKNTLNLNYKEPADPNDFSLDVILDFLKEDATTQLIDYIKKWQKENNIDKVWYYTYKGKKAYDRLSGQIRNYYIIEKITSDYTWDNALPSAWNGGHDPNLWVYNEIVDDKLLSGKGIMVFGNKNCILIRYERVNKGDFEGELLIHKKRYN